MRTVDLPIKNNKLQTKRDVEQALKQIGDPIRPLYSKGFAKLHIGNTSAAFPDSVAKIEGFSRLLWGLVPLLAGGEDYDLWDLHLEGIKNGTNPSHEEYWGEINDYDQRIVEMAAFGVALALIPDKIWDPLSKEEKDNLANWLKQVNDHSVHDCNWIFFRVLVNMGLKKVGESYDPERMEKDLDRIEQFYLVDGWYADGINAHVDYYIPFAIHYYSLFYAKLMKDDDPERAKRYKDRASMFAEQFVYWFAKDGSAIPYGRSLTYRFAQSAFWSAMVFAEVEGSFSYGVMKGLILNNLRWWFQQPIFNRDGSLTVGYRYPNLIMGEGYNSSGSPYWALKTFLILALTKEHPFWQSEELPLPPLHEKSVQHSPHLVLYRQEEKNHVVAFNSGHLSTNNHAHTSAKYEKFAYSNFFGFSVPRAEWGLEQGAFDSMLALSEGDNIYRVKRKSEETKIEGGIIHSKWMPWFDVEVNTWIIPGAPWHIRIHRIDTERYLDTAEGGFALGLENEDFQNQAIDKVQNEKNTLARFPWGVSGIRSIYGNGKPKLIYPNSNTNLIHSRTVIPTVTNEINQGTHWLVSAVFGEPGVDTGKWNTPPKVEIVNDKIIVDSENGEHIRFQKGMKAVIK